jgi:septum formation protein
MPPNTCTGPQTGLPTHFHPHTGPRNKPRISTALMPLILASTSPTRLAMLRAAGLDVTPIAPRVDEVAVRDALTAEGAHPRDIADTLAEMKARKVAEKHPEATVLGCDQVVALDRETFAKPETPEDARQQLRTLRGKTHKLLSAIVAYRDAESVWRHVGEARLTMHQFSDVYLDDYVTRNWDSIRHSVGCYKIEEEGVRLFSAITGDHFTILGLPLLPLLAWAGTTGMIAR